MSYLKDKNPATTEYFTVEEIIDMLENDLLDLNPIFQRGEVASKAWMTGVIQAIWRNAPINSFHFRKMPHPCKYRYQVLDGLQRLSAIINYFNNEIAINTNKDLLVHLPLEDIFVKGYWDDQKQDKKNIFLARTLTTIVYNDKMTNVEAAEVFGRINDNNKLKDQELRNAIIGYISEAIRQTVNPHSSERSRKHPLFEVLDLQNSRRQVDEAYAKMFQYEYNQAVAGDFNKYVVSAKSLWEMYTNSPGQTDESSTNNITRISHRRLNMLMKMYDHCEPRLRKEVFKMAALVFHYTFLLYIETQYKIEDMEAFSEKYTETFFQLYNDKETTYDGKQANRPKVLFSEYIGLKFLEQVEYKMKIMLNALEGVGLSEKPELDEIRYYPLCMVHKRWIEVGKICEFTGKKTSFDDIVGGHIIPHSRGGKTVYENLIVLDKRVNLKMGTMTPEEFKAKEEKLAA
jgi:hypothetical protein